MEREKNAKTDLVSPAWPELPEKPNSNLPPVAAHDLFKVQRRIELGASAAQKSKLPLQPVASHVFKLCKASADPDTMLKSPPI